jgi:hypothetical protein
MATVKVKNPHFYRAEWRGDLTEAPPTVKKYGSTVFRPMTADITYMLSGHKWVPYQIVITGPRLKKDGTNGKTLISSEYDLIWSADNTPGWILTLARCYVPKAVSL